MNQYDPSDYALDNEDDEYLTRVVVDTCSRTFYMYSSEGDTKEVPVDTADQFMDVLEIVRAVCDPDIVFYSDPVVADWPPYIISTSISKKVEKIILVIFDPLYFFMITYPPSFYDQILECYEYETRNPTIYGNVILREVEFTKSGEELQPDWQGDENHL